jgi:YHS domain-containing protein
MKTRRWVLVLAVLGGLSTACAASPLRAPEGRAEAAVRPPGEARIGDRTTCPVSGEQFLVSATSAKAEYRGRTYYFCCADCAKRFEADPAKFLRTSVEPAAESAGP